MILLEEGFSGLVKCFFALCCNTLLLVIVISKVNLLSTSYGINL